MDEIKVCDSILSRFLGLMFRKKQVLHFKFKKPKKYSIHTFFVFFPIDIEFLDEDNKIIEIKKNLRPFSAYFPKNKYYSFIERPHKE